MVFFNYSTMQMAAKVVYYGPGLCGKTTNLQHIYSRTSSSSRGEMVSLETETDRTLFFDLLPLEVGKIQGFKTRIQLYTVPGQVFYNTTRKLVLKGVDGIVFVADSQRAMEQANVESLDNLKANLDEIGLTFDEVPIVLQYNKRDLSSICSVEEMEATLNRGSWPSFEASALTGPGVFDTLRGISKLTLVGLKKRLTENSRNQLGSFSRPTQSTSGSNVTSVPEPTVDVVDDVPSPPYAPRKTAPDSGKESRKGSVDILAELEKIRQQAQKKNAELTGSHGTKDAAQESATAGLAGPSNNTPNMVDPDDPSGAFEVAAFAAAAKELSEPGGESPVAQHETANLSEPNSPLSAATAAAGLPEIELDLPLTDEQAQVAAEPSVVLPDQVSGNGRREIDHSFQFHPTLASLERATRISFRLRIEDSENSVVDTFNEAIQVSDPESIRHLLLNLRIALDPTPSEPLDS